MEPVKVYAPQEIWDKNFSKYGYNFKSLVNYNDAIVKLIYKYIPPVKECEEKNYYEIGCYLARYMYHFGKLGYTLNGIDQSPDMNEKFVEYLHSENFKTGEIENGDIFKLKPEEKFDIVASFGFIEHFSNFTDLIDLHFRLARKGSYIIITIPNLRGPVQNFLHRLVDKEHLEIHNLKAMQPTIWRTHIKKYEYEKIFDGYTGGFDFWIGEQKRNIFQRLLLKFIYFPPLIRALRGIKHNSWFYSPYYLMILRKK